VSNSAYEIIALRHPIPPVSAGAIKNPHNARCKIFHSLRMNNRPDSEIGGGPDMLVRRDVDEVTELKRARFWYPGNYFSRLTACASKTYMAEDALLCLRR
jgi:hypothetical protein